MKKVITYGTYDLLHEGHVALIKRAKALGDYLIVGVTSDSYDKSRGKLNVQQPLLERVEAIKKLGLADQIIVEEFDGQKINDIEKYNVDVFTVGSDWLGKFDYLSDLCEIVYLDRTQGVSSTEIRTRQFPILRLGLIGLENPVDRFISEAEKIDGIAITEVYSADADAAKRYAEAHELNKAASISAMEVDAVYITETVEKHYDLIMQSLMAGFHVMCESPLFLTRKEAEEVYAYADRKGLVLFEALKTAFFPAYEHLMLLVKTGVIGEVKDIEVSFSKNPDNFDRIRKDVYQGSLYDLISYVLCPVFKILGPTYSDCKLYTYQENGFNLYTKGIIQFSKAVSTFKTGKGVKTEGNLVITGTKGYVYVPAPWWITEYFEVRYEDLRSTKKFFYKCEESGLRYEILEFIKMVNHSMRETPLHPRDYVLAVTDILEFSNSEGAIDI